MVDGWFLLASVTLTGLFTIGGLYLGGRREGAHWRRSERKTAYSELLREADRTRAEALLAIAKDLDVLNDDPGDGWISARLAAEMGNIPALASIAIVGPKPVYEAAARLVAAASVDMDVATKGHLAKHQQVIDDLKTASEALSGALDKARSGDYSASLDALREVTEPEAPPSFELTAYAQARTEFLNLCSRVLRTTT